MTMSRCLIQVFYSGAHGNFVESDWDVLGEFAWNIQRGTLLVMKGELWGRIKRGGLILTFVKHHSPYKPYK